MSETIHARCDRLCGDANHECFVNNSSQLTCLADMLVNKVYGLSSVLEILKAEELPDSAREFLDESLDITDELINWVKYLQMTHDIKSMAVSLQSGAEGNRRKEDRFQFPEVLHKHIKLMTGQGDDLKESTLIDFSKSGLQLVTIEPLEPDTVFDAQISAPRVGKFMQFKARVKHTSEHLGAITVGASLEEANSPNDLHFFHSIMEFISSIKNNGA